MSCRTTPAGSAWTTFARLESGLTDVQTLSTFHALRREGRGVPGPTQDEWQAFAREQADQMEAAGFSEARTASLTRRMERAYEQTPDGATWYALRNIRERARSESSNVQAQLQEVAARTGETYETVATRYQTYLDEVDRGRSVTAPEGYDEARDAWRQQGLPADHGTYTALTRLRAEAQAAVADNTPPRRIEAVDFPNSRAIYSAGYDPHDGRLEVTFRRRDRDGNTTGTSRTYAYRGVPAEVWARMNSEEGPGHVYNQEVRNHDEYRYDSREDEDAAAHRRCTGCGQWWAPGHACPTRAAEETPEAPARRRGLVMVDQLGNVHTPEESDDYADRVRAYEAEGLTTSDAQSRVEAEDLLAERAATAELRDRLTEDTPEVPVEEIAASVSAAVTATQAEPTPEPEPEPTPEPEVPARPEPVTMSSLYVYGQYRHINSRRMGYGDPGRYDYASVPTATQIRPLAQAQPVIVPVNYSGSRYGNSADGLPRGYFTVTGSVVFDRPARGQWNVEPRELQCNCPEYQANYRCPHVDYALERYRAHLIPQTSRSSSAPVDTAAAQRAAEEAIRADWMRTEEHAAEARARHAALSNPEDSYTDNFAAFEADHNAALERKANGEEPVPFMTTGALGGEFTRESGRGFGVEMEFDFPNTMSHSERATALRNIGRKMYEAGLTPVEHQQGYHASAARGYTDNHARGWSFERDCTVSGEIVSPVMYDEPETWNNIQKVCDIIREEGGIANAKTGSHVHIGAKNMTTQTATELMRMTNQHEDIMYRLSQNPDRPSHRPMRWCGPNADVPQGGYTEMYQVSNIGRSHGFGMNLAGVRGGESDHPEVRYWDGTLNPAVIQAQVKVSAGLVQAAERNASLGQSRRGREAVGSHHNRLQAVRGRSRRALTSEELAEDTATVRSFVDTLFTRREDKAQVAALFAVTKWQRRR